MMCQQDSWLNVRAQSEVSRPAIGDIPLRWDAVVGNFFQQSMIIGSLYIYRMEEESDAEDIYKSDGDCRHVR